MLLLALALPAAAADKFRIDQDHTFAHFAVVHTGVSSVRGRMAVARGSATFDKDRQAAEVTVEMDPNSLDTGVKRLDALLTGEMFFDAGKFRTVKFTGKGAKFKEGVPTEFDGELTIKGIARPVQLAADRFVCQQVRILVLERFVCGGDLHATVRRSDFGLDKYSDMVSDEVRLTISVEAIREE
ncbi:MAG TPA: YceI family protein [Burkholderiales bacterium]|nr:YceI family protein [Burkholderiales bacterium]